MRLGDFYMLVKEDLSSLGSMGSSPTVVWRKYFKGTRTARLFAENDWKKPITWKASGDSLTSGDLLTHLYTISPIRTED